MLKVVAILVSSFLLSACVDEGNANQSTNISYVVASAGLQTGINSQQIYVLKNSAEYSNLMSNVQLLGQIPNPDFSQSMLVGIFTTLNSCYSISIDSVRDVNGSILVSVNITSENIEACNPVVGSSYIIVDIAQSPEQVSVVFNES